MDPLLSVPCTEEHYLPEQTTDEPAQPTFEEPTLSGQSSEEPNLPEQTSKEPILPVRTSQESSLVVQTVKESVILEPNQEPRTGLAGKLNLQNCCE